ncbi:MAG: Ig-like domain-containing protein [Lachnospiraceae bacterium]|nr:Ig-like domain-containing protein [Lachnospiraceae bacterium]
MKKSRVRKAVLKLLASTMTVIVTVNTAFLYNASAAKRSPVSIPDKEAVEAEEVQEITSFDGIDNSGEEGLLEEEKQKDSEEEDSAEEPKLLSPEKPYMGYSYEELQGDHPFLEGFYESDLFSNGRLYASVNKGYVPSRIPDGYTLNLIPMQSFNIRFQSKFNMKNALWNSDQGMTAVYNSRGRISYYQDKVVRITPAGKLTAIGLGKTTIAAASADGMWIRGFTVNVVEYPKTSIYINKGKTKQLSFYKAPANKMIYATSNALITGLVNKGKVSGNAVGCASVMGYYDPYNTGKGFGYGVYVFVEDPVLMYTTGMVALDKSLKNAGLVLNTGASYQIYLANVYHHGVYSSSNPAVATVSASGMINAHRPGITTIRDKINGKTFSIRLAVVNAQ